MKSTLTSADPSGWYLCDYVYDDCNFNFCARGMLVQWTGNSLIYCGDLVQGNDWAGLSNFRPIGDEVFNEELRTLREELATNKHSLDVCSKYAESMQRSSEDYLNELRKAREENATLQNQADSLLKQAEQLEAELARLKSQPYAIRQANEPDCEGLWRNCCGAIREWHETDLAGSNGFHYGPYHYIGPLPVIPVVVEQQPPKVVGVRCKKTGEVCRAIPSPCGSSLAVLNDDGSFRGNEMAINWEEVQ